MEKIHEPGNMSHYKTGGFSFFVRLLPALKGTEVWNCVKYLENNLCVFNNGATPELFSELCQHFETTRKDFFGNTLVYVEVFGEIKLSSNKTSIEDLKFWVKEFFLPKLQHLVFPDADVSVYTSTRKEAEKDGYTKEKHRNLYEKALRAKGFTPVEVVIYSRFDFTGVLQY